jgi:hypothetical protein
MTIQVSQGLAVTCNLCALSGPIVRMDYNRYNRQGPGNEIYSKQLDRKASALAKKDGFFFLEKLVVGNNNNIDIWGHPINGAISQKMHICPGCLENIKMFHSKDKSFELKATDVIEE